MERESAGAECPKGAEHGRRLVKSAKSKAKQTSTTITLTSNAVPLLSSLDKSVYKLANKKEKKIEQVNSTG